MVYDVKTKEHFLAGVRLSAMILLVLAAYPFRTGAVSLETAGRPVISSGRIQSPGDGKIYHGAYPGGITGEEDDITLQDVQDYEAAAGLSVAWVYFSNNWYRSRLFPSDTATWITAHGSVPFIRLMMRSSPNETGRAKERVFTSQAIIDGKFDADLVAWADSAKNFGNPLIVEYGTECNGNWFCWNGQWNGGSRMSGYGSAQKPDGPERFVDAYRHIVQLMRNRGATNITWVFHVNYDSCPAKEWNNFENYYPGDDVVDWIAVSNYGAQTPMSNDRLTFRENMDNVYSRMTAMAPGKPMIVAEFGCTEVSRGSKAAPWAASALNDLMEGERWPAIIGFSWWNEKWQNDNHAKNDTNMRLQDNQWLKFAFSSRIAGGGDALDLVQVKSFAYQIQNIESPVDADALALSSYDMLIIEPTATIYDQLDYDISGTVAILKDMPASDMIHRKKIIAYVDIGQAETWRYYWTWSSKWARNSPRPVDWPDYILTPDPDGWAGDYNVAFWDDDWKKILMYGPDIIPDPAPRFVSLVDELIIDGFDGIYLDWVEAYDDPAVIQAALQAGKDPKAEMIKLIGEIRDYARLRNPSFVVIQQNAASLLDGHPELLGIIDGIGQEDVWCYGRSGVPWSSSKGYDILQDPGFTSDVILKLDQFLSGGKPVFTTDYAVKHASEIYEASRAKGYVPYCTRVDLSHLSTTPPPP